MFYITTPIYYSNDIPHLGHLSTTISADIIARYHRLIGDKTLFLTGVDEHGEKVEQTAKKAGRDPQEFVDQMATCWQEY
ncbi:MAG: class I tRNA ligase family protein, partial [Patescibacteria group bacterium]